MKNKIIIISIIAAVLVIAGIFTYSPKQEKAVAVESSKEKETPLSKTEEKYICTEEANVWWTECIIEKLDRAAAEREWKQRKLEAIKSPQVNEENMVPQLSDEQEKIRKWRQNFETGRDSWCEAQMSFRAGSGTPGGIAACELEFEIKAIEDLNYLHYDIIVKSDYGTGIPNFEPTEADIDQLIKTNKTTRGCVWAGEDECE